MTQKVGLSWLPLRRKGSAGPEKKMTRPTEKNVPSPSVKWDVLVLLLLTVVTVYIDLFVPPYVQSVNLDDPNYKFPHIPDIVSDTAVIIVNFLGPFLVLLLTQVRTIRFIRPLFVIFALSLVESNVITMLITTVFKVIAGRPRPYFSSVCESYAPDVENLCVGHERAVRESRKSFPSGHSSLSFSAATFVFLYLVHRLRISEAGTPARLGRMVLSILPLIGAGLIAVSRTIDYHHHYSDVVAGTALGGFIAAFVFWARTNAISKAIESTETCENEYAPVATVDEDSV
ncbi:unnamed protein product [Agarophyton chilense]